ncbi:MAG TPA: ROK family transcriptional regulator [Candidatus Limnocylindria bacterium]|jgi:glucokinase-like ROK family protein
MSNQPPRPVTLPDEALDALVHVLDAIRHSDGLSRTDVVHRTGLGRSVVAQRVGELIDRGLIRDDDTGPSRGGRPPRRLVLNAAAGRLLVADLGATSLDVALTDLAGTILVHRAEPCDIGAGPEPILSLVEGHFAEMLAADPGPLWGVGIGVPGPVEFRTARPVSPPIMPGWDGVSIRERFSDRFGAPVWVDNDVNVMALGEWRSGIAAGHENVIFVKIGTGIGAGLISDGQLHRGAQGAAGDVGHIQVTDDPSVVCRCGNVGCLEAAAGGGALGRVATEMAADGSSAWLAGALARHGTLTAKDVAEAARRGDPASVELLQRSGRLVGGMLAGVVNLFNPSLIVIGGGVAASGDQLLAAIRETVYRRSLPLATRDLVIQRSSLGNLAGVTGAAAMVADQLFSLESMAGWLDAGTPSGLPVKALSAAS